MNVPAKKYLRHQLRIEVTEACQTCKGTGLQLHGAYENINNCLKVIVRVCPCVQVVIDTGKVKE